MNNPFDITKAVDFTNDEIIKYWVDISPKGFQENLLKPASLMPMIILGSKGSGKTHLMRFFSYELQKIKYKNNLRKGLDNDKFIGVYVRCSGLNSDRFSGKGQSDEVWGHIYAYYWELWIGQIILNILTDLRNEGVLVIENEQGLISDILKLFNQDLDLITNLEDLISMFSNLQRQVDYETENCIFNRNRSLNINILLSPAKITYGLPEIFSKNISFFKDKKILYLIDELENFSENQQKLIQTIIREKPVGCTFRLGARLYGIKTYTTLGSGEENIEGSEFTEVVLDEFLRSSKKYGDFIRKICQNRLNTSGYMLDEGKKIDDYLDSFSKDCFLSKIEKSAYRNTPLKRLAENLSANSFSQSEIKKILSNLKFENVLIERTNIFLFYRSWKDKNKLLESSEKIGRDAKLYFKNSKSKTQQKTLLKYFENDIIDMLAREMRLDFPHYGFETLLNMSCGTPRNMLNILKYSFDWVYFSKDKYPFKEINIDQSAQQKGIRDTIEWFFEDNRIPAIEGGKAIDTLKRLGRFLQELKYSDVPPECSINIFGIRMEDLSEDARIIFNYLQRYSYIIRSEDRRDKNSNEKFQTYHINWTISPSWELSTAKRGIIFLSKIEAEYIFNLAKEHEFRKLLKSKTQRYTAPFSGLQTQDLFSDLPYDFD